MRVIRTLADIDNPSSLSNRMRARRFAHFERLAHGLARPLKVVDLGGTPSFWQRRGWADRDDVFITTVNLDAEESSNFNIKSEHGDVMNLSQFRDQSFDIAFSNSVIEHLFSFENQKKMADEVQRLARAYWIQTPNHWFPIEPHFHVPGWQWMPVSLRKALIRRMRCGWRGPCPDPQAADRIVREVQLLTKRQLRCLFPTASIVPERFAGLVKSWIVHSGFQPETYTSRKVRTL